MIRIIYILLLLTGIGSSKVFSQDVTFSQFYSNPLYLNPAMAGSIEAPRINLQYRNQWPKLNNAYNTVSASFDVLSEKLKSGVGIHLLNDVKGGGLLNLFQADLMLTKKIRLSDNLNFQGGIQLGVRQNSLNWNNLIFQDNVDANFGQHGISNETPIEQPSHTSLDVATGILLYSNHYFIGIAGHHLNQANQSYYQGQDNSARLAAKYTLHFGARIPIFKHGHLRKKFDLSPQVILQNQDHFRQFNYGLMGNVHGLSAGLWLRQNFTMKYDALIFLVGFMKKRWHITYSYDWTISGLYGGSGGSSEISFSMLLKNPSKVSYLPFYRVPEKN